MAGYKMNLNSTANARSLMRPIVPASAPAIRNALLLLCQLATTGAASAQSNVTIYGILDAAVRYSDGLDSAYAGSAGSSTMVNSGVNSTSRLGFRGSEDLGDGLLAVFNLESGVSVDTGSSANSSKFFDRASYVGLQTNRGVAMTLGRQTTLLADAVGPVDPLGSRFASFNPNITVAALSAARLGLEYGPAGTTAGAYRLDNSIKVSGKVGDITGRAMYAFGEQSGNSSGLSLTYQSSNTSAALAYSQFKTATGLELKGYLGGVSTKLGNSKLSLSYGSNEGQTTVTAKTRNTTLGLGGNVALTDFLGLTLGHYRVSRTRTAGVDDGFNRTVAFLEYLLSKRSLVYAELDQTNWKNGYQGAGFKDSASGMSFGVKHTF
jgi:predicted porin